MYKSMSMTNADHIRNGIIDKLLTISNPEYLQAISLLLDKREVDTDEIKVSEEQTLMLKLSDEDIQNQRLITQDELDKSDLKWLEEL